ncbi:MAG TPA: hypothetical protein VIL25_03910 [Vicinamibacterales bacterium]
MKYGSLLLALVALGCTRPTFTSGESCTLNSDCTEPLVCGLERCRRQCDDSRDCAAGLRCLRVDGLGVCQLPEESRCALASDCPAGLVCRFGTCTTECAADRDCPPGASCQLDEESGARACEEVIAESCIYHSDCGEPFVCGPDQRCRLECVRDVDCDPLRYCDTTIFRCMPRFDAGL